MDKPNHKATMARLSGTVIATNLHEIGDFNLKAKQIAGYNQLWNWYISWVDKFPNTKDNSGNNNN